MAEEVQEQAGLQEFLIDMNSRVRDLEGKYNMLRDRVLIINQNMVEEYKKTLNELRVVNSDIKDIKKEMFQIKEALRHLVQEIDFFARKEDVKLLEKYINLWNPMNFTTEKEVIKIVQDELTRAKKEEEKTQKKGDYYG